MVNLSLKDYLHLMCAPGQFSYSSERSVAPLSRNDTSEF